MFSMSGGKVAITITRLRYALLRNGLPQSENVVVTACCLIVGAAIITKLKLRGAVALTLRYFFCTSVPSGGTKKNKEYFPRRLR